MGVPARATDDAEPRRPIAISTPAAFWACLFAVVIGLLALALVGVVVSRRRS